MSLTLTTKQVSHLRSLAHHLEPVVQIGKLGVSEAVIEQIDQQLLAHELIKVRFGQEAVEDAKAAREQVVQATRSQLIQTAGRTLVLYRRHPQKPKIRFSEEQGSDSAKTQRQDPRLSLRRKLGKARRAQLAGEDNGAEGKPGKPERASSTLSRLQPKRGARRS